MALAPQRNDSALDLHIRTSRHGQKSSAQRVVAVGHPDRGPCVSLPLNRQFQDFMPRRAGAKPRWSLTKRVGVSIGGCEWQRPYPAWVCDSNAVQWEGLCGEEDTA